MGKSNVCANLHPFIACLQDNFLEQLVTEPTWGQNFLDLILTSDSGFVSNIVVEEPFASSDHQMISFSLLVYKAKQPREAVTFNYFKADYDKIREDLKPKLLNIVIDNDTEENWSRIKQQLIEARDKCVPKNKRKHNKCKWATKNVVKCRRAKKKAWNNYVKSGKNGRLYTEYCSKLRESVRINKKAKLDFELKLAKNVKTDAKSFYSYIRSTQRCKDKVGHVKYNAEYVINEDKSAADVLNNYFASVFTKEDLSNIPEPTDVFKGSIQQEGLDTFVITEELVFKKLSELNVNKCCGPDDLHPKLLYELKSEIAKPLAILFNMSLRSGKIPQEWKDAHVTALCKKGAKDKCENYRPISLTSIVGKLLESLIKDKIVVHLDTFK
ncbi:MAG TPA: hypothetical protein VF760_04300 [Xanthobacteraceae bacterium]